MQSKADDQPSYNRLYLAAPATRCLENGENDSHDGTGGSDKEGARGRRRNRGNGSCENRLRGEATKVTLVEQNDHLGGQLDYAVAPPV